MDFYCPKQDHNLDYIHLFDSTTATKNTENCWYCTKIGGPKHSNQRKQYYPLREQQQIHSNSFPQVNCGQMTSEDYCQCSINRRNRTCLP